MDKSYKARKEDFVSNLSGGDLLEINLVTFVAPASVLLWSALQSRRAFFIPYGPRAIITDFLLNVGAILFAITAYSSQPLLLNLLLITPTIFLTLATRGKATARKSKPPPRQDGASKASSSPSTDKPLLLPSRPFLTIYRATMMITTCLAILAVDFRIFPRRFAKVENWGTSIMDLGVGSFVFSAGVVSARAILSSKLSSTPKDQARLPQRLLSATRHSIPLLILGLIRLYSVKGLDYAEHVTEYGVHWNFFFTLALLPPFVEIFHTITTTIIPSYNILAILLAAVYEIILDTTDLKPYILISPRGESLLSKNREGIFSFIGYLAIFLAGRGTGLIVIPEPTNGTGNASPRSRLLKSLTLRTVSWWLFFAIITASTIRLPPFPTSWDTQEVPSSSSPFSRIPIIDIGLNLSVSRRLANLPYVIWVVAFNTMHILFFCLIETYYFPSAAQSKADSPPAMELSPILSAFNKNGLPIFLVANLLTGTVNLTVSTIDMGPVQSMGVLVAYAAAVTAVAVGLDRMGWRLRF